MTTAQKRRHALHRILRSGDTPEPVNPTDKKEAMIDALGSESTKDVKPQMTRPPAHSGYHAGARR
ncbi:MAG: hypothetical protein AAB442_01365 [Patescibacteria group bacterium]|mgnify:CR=1 FL=1